MQHGANLHARTKNQETPYDICEDAELRERIMQLINEQETKRLHEQTRRVRRAHSNTRTQSVRRTSIREKTLTPKKEAQEEARIRLQLENKKKPLQEDSPALGGLRAVRERGDTAVLTTFPAVIPANNINNNNNATKENFLVEEEEEELKKENKEKEKEDTGKESTIHEEEENRALPPPAVVVKKEKELVTRSSSGSSSLNGGDRRETNSQEKEKVEELVSTPPVPPPRSSSTSRPDIIATTGTVSGGNVNGSGMVTHSGEGGTDLKKQRAMSRASQNSYTLAPASSTYSLSTPEYDSRSHGRNPEFTASSVRVDTVTYRPPPSPSLTPRKFVETQQRS
ncbi:putative protein phosphatase 1 regulatory subunit 16A isoform X1 [Penaeus vannamei]|uniref:Uncharacterized protein n=1 Tax=Penaeus vannamei TaxID=6689 RepID=A0A3R7Q3M7_PENVA|nr:putative protein phosphatase 1 regulatory subunit 16A isoform X1 [Penaeus vannamei]